MSSLHYSSPPPTPTDLNSCFGLVRSFLAFLALALSRRLRLLLTAYRLPLTVLLAFCLLPPMLLRPFASDAPSAFPFAFVAPSAFCFCVRFIASFSIHAHSCLMRHLYMCTDSDTASVIIQLPQCVVGELDIF